ncbi:unnamed protein product, partial [Closterium sp. NIES-54]
PEQGCTLTLAKTQRITAPARSIMPKYCGSHSSTSTSSNSTSSSISPPPSAGSSTIPVAPTPSPPPSPPSPPSPCCSDSAISTSFAPPLPLRARPAASPAMLLTGTVVRLCRVERAA